MTSWRAATAIAGLTLGLSIATGGSALASTHVGVGIGIGVPLYAPPPPVYYYPPPPVYYAPPPVVYSPPPPVYNGPIYAAPQQTSSPVAPPPPQTGNCRQYQGDATIDGRNQPFYGTACLGPDGKWHITNQ